MGEMKKLRNAVLEGLALGQGQKAPLPQEAVELQPIEESPVEPVLARGPGRRSDWHYWAANWAAKNPDIPRDESFSLKMAEAYRAWKDAHPGQTYLDFRGTDVIDGRRRLTQKKGKKVAPPPFKQPIPVAPMRQATPPPPRQATPPRAPVREPSPAPMREPSTVPMREPSTAPAPMRQPSREPSPAPMRQPLREPSPPRLRQKTPNKYSPPSTGPLSTPSLLQGRRETPPQEYYDIAEEEQEIPQEEALEQEAPEQEVPEQEAPEQEVPEQEVPEQEVPEEEQPLSPEEEASIEAAQQEQLSPEEEEQPEASPEWPEEEDGDLEIVTVGQQEYFRTSNNGLFAVVRDDQGNPEPGPWAGVLSDDGTQVLEVDQPEAP